MIDFESGDCDIDIVTHRKYLFPVVMVSASDMNYKVTVNAIFSAVTIRATKSFLV